jgi:long-chain acyl-CoA synthetase
MATDVVTSESRPWLRFYGDVPASLEYPDLTLYESVARSAARSPDAIAYDFLGSKGTYRELIEDIDRCADALASLGLSAGERITISLPTSRQGVVAFYAVAKLGAVASLIHPLSTAEEIETYLNISGSRFAFTLDAFFDRFANAPARTSLRTLILTRITDGLPITTRAGFWLTRGRKIPRVPASADVVWWSTLMREWHEPAQAGPPDVNELAAILYSGGTTGTPKGIMLSHRNFLAEATELAAWVRLDEHDTVLAILPIFHGFGLAALIHAPLMRGARVVLVPVFSAETVAKLIRTKKPTLMAGVPTLYDSLSRDPSLQRADLSCLRAAFSGADTLPTPVKERFEGLVASRGGQVKLMEGYGLTEAVTAVIATPLNEYREGSIGIPFPDMLAKICRSGTDKELPPGQEGEICLSGPAVMMGYMDDPEATAVTLREHSDGRIWLHTGDIGTMDEDGFFAFTSRLKRMIKSSGFNVYPAQVEAVLFEHTAVSEACVIGVPDEAQGERVVAVVVLHDPSLASPETADELIAACRARLIKWSCPRSVEFRTELPKTRVGKIDFVELTREAAERASGAPAAVPGR